MKIYLAPGEGHVGDLIRTFKHRTLDRHNDDPDCWGDNLLPVPPELYEPLPIAQYLVAWTDDGTRAIGMAEGYFLDQLYGGYEDLAPGLTDALAPLCPFENLAFFQTIYVDSPFRAHTPFLYLCLSMVHLGVRLGAQGGVCFTDTQSEFHHRLYEKTGGRLVANVEVTYSNGTRLRRGAYYFDLPRVCQHPRLQHALSCTHIDEKLARKTYNWRYAPTQ